MGKMREKRGRERTGEEENKKGERRKEKYPPLRRCATPPLSQGRKKRMVLPGEGFEGMGRDNNIIRRYGERCDSEAEGGAPAVG